MTGTGSRTYKLRLSSQGVDLFLRCHCRLAGLVQDFIPYGATLAVAVALLDRLGVDDIAVELETVACSQFVGDRVHFVGCTTRLVDVMQRVTGRLLASDYFSSKPARGKLYFVGLVAFAATADDELTELYHRASG